MEKIMETFGKRLKELRTQKHKTQVEMQNCWSVQTVTIREWSMAM